MFITTIISKCEIDSLIEIVKYTQKNESNPNDIEYYEEIIEDLEKAKTGSTCNLKLHSSVIDVLVELVENAQGVAAENDDWYEYDNYSEILDTLISAQERYEEEELSGIYED